jgi:hypothetical protein
VFSDELSIQFFEGAPMRSEGSMALDGALQIGNRNLLIALRETHVLGKRSGPA